MKENQRSVWTWVLDTFGRPATKRSLDRLMEEVKELRKLYSIEADLHPSHQLSPTGIAELSEECADVVICMYSFAEAAGFDLHEAIDAKMVKNRARKWRLMGDGTGYHVKETA